MLSRGTSARNSKPEVSLTSTPISGCWHGNLEEISKDSKDSSCSQHIHGCLPKCPYSIPQPSPFRARYARHNPPALPKLSPCCASSCAWGGTAGWTDRHRGSPSQRVVPWSCLAAAAGETTWKKPKLGEGAAEMKPRGESLQAAWGDVAAIQNELGTPRKRSG